MIRTIVGILATCTIAALTACQGEVDLRWKFNTGRMLRYREIETTTFMTDPTEPMVFDRTFTWTVLNVDAQGNAEILNRTELVKSTLMGEFTPGSRGTNPEAFQSRFQMAPAGRIQRTPPATAKEATEVRGIPTDAETIFNMKQLRDFILPEKRVRPGDTWSAMGVWKQGEKHYEIVQRYTLSRVEGGRAWIEMNEVWRETKNETTHPEYFEPFPRLLRREAVFSVDRGVLLSMHEVCEFRMRVMNKETGRDKTTELILLSEGTENEPLPNAGG